MGGSSRRTGTYPAPRALLAVASLLITALLLAACGGSEEPAAIESARTDASPEPSRTPPPVVTPFLTPASTATPTPTPTPTPLAAVPETTEQELARALLNAQDGVYGFVVLDSDGTVLSSYNSATPFITASTYKLVVMADIYQRIERGELSLDDSVQLNEDYFIESGGDMYFTWEEAGTWVPVSQLLYAVGAYSSNVAAYTLLEYTNPESLRATAAAIGMQRTYLFVQPEEIPYWPPEPGIDSSAEDMALAREYIEASARQGTVNVTTPLDMATYQLGLAHGEVISPWVSEQILTILEDQLIRDRIPVLLPDGVRVANKPGNLEDVVNDVGVIFLPEGPRAIAALSEAVPDAVHATRVLQRLALIATGATDIPPLP